MSGARRVLSLEARYRRAAIVAAALLLLATVFVFAKGHLFRSGYEIRAVVPTVSQLAGSVSSSLNGLD